MEQSQTIIERAKAAVKAFKNAKTSEEVFAIDRRCATIKAQLKTIYDQTQGPCDAWSCAKQIEHARMQRVEDLSKEGANHV
jgi:hypothetical protein